MKQHSKLTNVALAMLLGLALSACSNKQDNQTPAIAKVNGITLHHASISGNVSFAEFTFDFDMKDGSKILWHEIIRSVWENGLIVEEQYFKS